MRKLPLSRVLFPIVVLFLVMMCLFIGYSTRDENLIPILSVDGPARKPVVKLFLNDIESMVGSLLQAGAPPQNEAVQDYRLTVDENALPEILKRELVRGETGQERIYYQALLWSELGGWQRSKITVRGASAWHHTPEKPSLRIKIARADQAGRRFIEVSRPEDPLALCNWLPDQIGESLGLMSARTRPARLYVNSKYLGLYLDTFRLGEPLALANGRLPGTFYQGENINGEVDLWSQPELWDSEGELAPEARVRFDNFLRLTRTWQTSPENVESYFELVDREKLAAWCAVLTFVSSYHSDDFHNQVFFYNTYRGKFEPVLWDVNGFGVLMEATANPDLVINLVQNAAYSDPRFLHLRNQYLWQLLQEAPEILEGAKADVERIMPDLEADTSLGGIGRLWPEAPRGFPFHISAQLVYRQTEPDELPRHLREFIEYFQQRVDVLTRYFSDASYQVEKTDTGSRVRVYGNVALEVRSKGEDLVFTGLNYSPGSSTLLFPGRKSGDQDQSLLRPIAVRRPAPLVYDFNNSPEELEFFHAHSGSPVAPAQTAPPNFRSDSIHPAYFFPKPAKKVALGPGIVELKEDLIVLEKDALEIAPGTILRLGAGVQLVCFGNAGLNGTPEKPILIERLDPDSPFGTVSFVGQDSLELKWIRIEGGSVSRYQGYAFKGMLNAYQVQKVTMEACSVGSNEVGDDAVNIANSEVDIRDCTFDGALSDALDLDRCTGRVQRCRFSNSGNDGLDLSHAELLVQQCRFTECGDKGISVGENSTVRLEELDIESCVIGIQCKDDSMARVASSRLVENRVALSAYRKKKIFSRGGTILYRDLELRDNEKNIEQQSRSVIAAFE